MTVKQLVASTAIASLLLFINKFVFFLIFNTDSLTVQIVFYVVTAVISLATVRRLGLLNYIEATLLAIIWIVAQFIIELLVLVPFIGYEVYETWPIWVSYIIMFLAVFGVHKKRHVAIRRGES